MLAAEGWIWQVTVRKMLIRKKIVGFPKQMKGIKRVLKFENFSSPTSKKLNEESLLIINIDSNLAV